MDTSAVLSTKRRRDEKYDPGTRTYEFGDITDARVVASNADIQHKCLNQFMDALRSETSPRGSSSRIELSASPTFDAHEVVVRAPVANCFKRGYEREVLKKFPYARFEVRSEKEHVWHLPYVVPGYTTSLAKVTRSAQFCLEAFATIALVVCGIYMFVAS